MILEKMFCGISKYEKERGRRSEDLNYK